MSEENFTYILNQLKKYKEEKNIDINSDIKKIVDYVFESLDNIVFDIKKDKYTKYEKNGSYLKKISKCPSNSSTGILHNKFMAILKKN